MAVHCCCKTCSICLATGASFGTAEEVRGVALAAAGGVFVHYSGAARTRLVSREIFEFPGNVMNVGIAGFYLPAVDALVPSRVGNVLRLLDVGGSVRNNVDITAGNFGNIYVTRVGGLVSGCELTMLVGCGGSVEVATGTITAGTLGATRPCTEPSRCIVM
jgi:hypothetical protein